MKLDDLLKSIKVLLNDKITQKETAKVYFEINIKDGGIGDCKVTLQNRITQFELDVKR